jgi:hypothetical protein
MDLSSLTLHDPSPALHHRQHPCIACVPHRLYLAVCARRAHLDGGGQHQAELCIGGVRDRNAGVDQVVQFLAAAIGVQADGTKLHDAVGNDRGAGGFQAEEDQRLLQGQERAFGLGQVPDLFLRPS